MTSQLCASVSENVKIMGMDIDAAPWKDDIVTDVPNIKDGTSISPQTRAWCLNSTRKKLPNTRARHRVNELDNKVRLKLKTGERVKKHPFPLSSIHPIR